MLRRRVAADRRPRHADPRARGDPPRGMTVFQSAARRGGRASCAGVKQSFDPQAHPRIAAAWCAERRHENRIHARSAR
ncbi:MAG: hypothetical protein MZV49_18550 [Rhodopseudomonas palustris]|nr:hypothetical protein [Rhodopseudomonas palustris]